MSMNSDQQNFKDLRRLLALKRHEQPPPGFFHSFSYQVLARIKAGELNEPAALADRLFAEAPWIQRLWSAFETKPVFAGSLSFALCGLIAAGLFYSDAPSGPNVGTLPGIFQTVELTEPSPLPPARPFGIEQFSTGNAVLPEHLRANPLLYNPQARVATVKWTQ
jgi:hypothetical protein